MLWAIKQLGPHAYDLAKFDEDPKSGASKEPNDVYNIRGSYCTCPAHVRICKHIAAITELQETDTNFNGLMYDPDTKVKYYWPTGERLFEWLENQKTLTTTSSLET